MTKPKTRTKQAAAALLKADRKAHAAVKPHRDTAPVAALSWLSEAGDQPQLLTLSAGVLAIGMVRGNKRMIRAGGRMIAAHLLATGIKNVVKHRVNGRGRLRCRAARM